MHTFKHRTCRVALMAALGAGLAGCETDVQVSAPAPVYVAPPVVVTPAPVVVEEAAPGTIVISSENDFYEPLRAYGRWDEIPGAGRCWIPTQVGPGWQPYTQGHWERTDAGWYWASDEPWGWATCHYGRWDWRQESGWFWAADVRWAPAWVSWRNGGGYVGWAPLPPAARYQEGRGVEFDANRIPPRSFVFVQEEHFMEPVRPTTVIVNNITIVNKTVNITNIKVVNQTIINEGPAPQHIAQASGHPVQVVKAVELRHQLEARVAIKPKAAVPAAFHENQPEQREPRPTQEKPRPVEKPAMVETEKPPREMARPVAATPERKVPPDRAVARPEPIVRPKPAPEERAAEERKVETRPPTTQNEHPASRPERPETAVKTMPGAKEAPTHPTPKPPVRRAGATNQAEAHRAPEKRPDE